MKYSVNDIAHMIEHVPKIGNGYEELERLCLEAIEYQFAAMDCTEASVGFCKNILKGSGVKASATISFPLSQSSTAAKLFEAEEAIKAGADEIGFGVNILEVKAKNYNYIKNEMNEIVKLCKRDNLTSKVTFENYYLSDEEKIWLCDIASEVEVGYVKTSTGFAPGGATVEDVKLMRAHVPSTIGVKASAGIRDLETLLVMVEAGATRIGTTSGVKIINKMREKNNI